MTYEEKQNRIKELQAEINELKSEGRRCSRPDAIKGKYSWLEQCGEERSYMSKLICKVCFPKIKKPHLHDWRNGKHTMMDYSYAITVKEMDDWQYKRYSEIVEKVAEILESYRYGE